MTAVSGSAWELEPKLRFALGDALFAEAIAATREAKGAPIIAGLCGPQGSGKSTTAGRLVRRLEAAGHRVATLSLDDFYLTRAERAQLSRQVHPLLATRGVPGTHDTGLLAEALSSLLAASDDAAIALPGFDKASDDRLPRREWRLHLGPADIVLLEGWCVGARPQHPASLAEPVNALERDEDSDGIWRRFVNERLADAYAPVFATLDVNLLLRAPSFGCIHRWRSEQEAGLSRERSDARIAMDFVAISRFIAHYERLTRWLMADEPAQLVADLTDDRSPLGWRPRGVEATASGL